ncbi:MAG: RidA family protein [Synergistetes bacterium]|nr:RidA family protein [Synergistota bacterium]MCX8128064.1 RidA family protein [Synergistota bacterium]MDW8193158.1 RidA family protein [Synergistota bacterium]
MKKKISTTFAPQAIGPYSQGIMCGKFLFVSGQLAIDPSTGKLIEGDIKIQTRRVLENIKAIVETAGGTMKDIIKTTCYLKDIKLFREFNEVYSTFFEEDPPARTTVEVSSLPREGALIEIDAIAYIEKD